MPVLTHKTVKHVQGIELVKELLCPGCECEGLNCNPNEIIVQPDGSRGRNNNDVTIIAKCEVKINKPERVKSDDL